jgi:ubiquinone/menaquinone biosynthesis C-methylase UbiE
MASMRGAIKREYGAAQSVADVLARVIDLKSVIDPLIEMAGIQRGDRVLDIGTGGGVLPIAISARVHCRIVGVDLLAKRVKLAKEVAKVAGLDIEYRVGDAEKLDFSSEFDRVVSQATINLLPDKEKVVREVARVLKPGGAFAFSDAFSRSCVPQTPKLWARCISGAIGIEKMRRIIDQSFQVVEVRNLTDVTRNLIMARKWDWPEFIDYDMEYWVIKAVRKEG